MKKETILLVVILSYTDYHYIDFESIFFVHMCVYNIICIYCVDVIMIR